MRKKTRRPFQVRTLEKKKRFASTAACAHINTTLYLLSNSQNYSCSNSKCLSPFRECGAKRVVHNTSDRSIKHSLPTNELRRNPQSPGCAGVFFVFFVTPGRVFVFFRVPSLCRAKKGYDDGDEAGIPDCHHLHHLQHILLLFFCLDATGSCTAARVRVADFCRLPGETCAPCFPLPFLFRSLNYGGWCCSRPV